MRRLAEAAATGKPHLVPILDRGTHLGEQSRPGREGEALFFAGIDAHRQAGDIRAGQACQDLAFGTNPFE